MVGSWGSGIGSRESVAEGDYGFPNCCSQTENEQWPDRLAQGDGEKSREVVARKFKGAVDLAVE